MSELTLYCGFCGKSQYEVKVLIVGRVTNICNKCVNDCVGMHVEHFGLGDFVSQILEPNHIVALDAMNVPSLDSLVAISALKSGGPYTGLDLVKAVMSDLQALLPSTTQSAETVVDDSPPKQSP